MMKKIIYIPLFVFSLYSLFSYSNPFWKHGIKYTPIPFVNKYILTKPQADFSLSFLIDYADGIYFGAFYNLEANLRLSPLFNFTTTFKLGENVPSLNTFSLSWIVYPIRYLKIFTNYKVRNFSKYKILEHNLSIVVVGLLDFNKMPRWFDMRVLSGINWRFIDLDIRDNNTKYRSDWLLEMFFLWQIKIFFHPTNFLSIGMEIGNYDKYVVYTSNYWQVKIITFFHLPKGFSLFITGGFSYVGSLPGAGIINRGWGELGIRYELQGRRI